jgi:hypothetical protein
MKNKTTQLIIAAVLAAGGYYLYTAYQKGMFPFKKKEPIPEPEPLKPLPPSPSPMPAPTPQPKPAPAGSGKASKAKVQELQGLLARRYSQAGWTGFTQADADGDAGSKTHAAIERLRPQTFKNFGLENSGNVQKYIDAFAADVASEAKAAEVTKTKQADVDKRKKTAAETAKLLKTGKYYAELLAPVRTAEHIYDPVGGNYRATDKLRSFSKGTRFNAMTDRGDGTLFYASGDSLYPISAQLLLLRSK